MTTSGASVNRSNRDTSLILEEDLAGLEGTARGSAEALLEALEPWLQEIGAEVELEDVAIVPIGEMDSVLVKLLWRHEGPEVGLLGSMLIEENISSAGAQATLDALNRKVSGIGSELVLE